MVIVASSIKGSIAIEDFLVFERVIQPRFSDNEYVKLARSSVKEEFVDFPYHVAAVMVDKFRYIEARFLVKNKI